VQIGWGELEPEEGVYRWGAIDGAATAAEMSLFPCNRGALVPGVGYDRAAYLAAWKQTIDAYEAAFPSVRKLVSAPVDVICAPDRDPSFYREVMGYALPVHSPRSCR